MSGAGAAAARRGLLWSPTVRVLNQVAHLFAAAVSTAVPFFLAVIAIPRLNALGASETVPTLVDRFYSIFPWVTLAIFFGTGFFNYLVWLAGTGYGAKQSLRTTYVRVLLVKVALAHVLVGFGITFGFSRPMQENARTWAWVLFGIAVVIFLISAALRRAPGAWHREARGAPAGPAA